MENSILIEHLGKFIEKDRIKQNEPMKKHTTFKIGGPAEIFIQIQNENELKSVLKIIKTNKIKFFIIGNGSNLLVSDRGIDGIVIKLELKDIKIQEENGKTIVDVASGVSLGFLAHKLMNNDISGFEEFAGIPGTIGGAITMNAGAHGKEFKDIVKEVKVLDYNGNEHILKNDEIQFSYRHSMFKEKKYIIISSKLVLYKGKKEEIKKKMDEYLKYRKDKQPIESPNAGSTFKRGIDFITAKLIDEAGLKGYKIGGAQVSEKHAGFIVNTGNATAKDVIELANYVEEKVYEKFKTKIELEIEVI